MTREENARQVINEVVPLITERWRTEAASGALDEEGDKLRRLAATKLATLNDVLIQLDIAIRGK